MYEMVRESDTYRRQDICIQGFGRETREKRYHLEGLGVGGSIILKCVFKKWDGKT
jgi:hypothetical protein